MQKHDFTKLVSAEVLLKELFPDESCRPTMRWLRMQTARRAIPFVRIGRLCFFDPVKVNRFIERNTIGGGAE